MATKAELLAAAEAAGIDSVDDSNTKAEIEEALAEAGVSTASDTVDRDPLNVGLDLTTDEGQQKRAERAAAVLAAETPGG